MIYLLDRNQIISHSVNKSERHPALSEIAKFISLSICMVVFLTEYEVMVTENNPQSHLLIIATFYYIYCMLSENIYFRKSLYNVKYHTSPPVLLVFINPEE